MATYQFNGDEVKIFPTLGLTLKPGDTFDSTENIISADVTISSATPKKLTPMPVPEPSAAPDTTEGE